MKCKNAEEDLSNISTKKKESLMNSRKDSNKVLVKSQQL